MKRVLLVSICFIFWLSSMAQEDNKVVGTWLTQYGDSKVTIRKGNDGKFIGEITWLKEPNRDGKPKVDYKNPDIKLQSRPTLGLAILTGFVYNKEDKEWVDGRIYDPKEGKTYKCLMWFEEDANKLHVKGYIGFSMIGKEVIWTKEK